MQSPQIQDQPKSAEYVTLHFDRQAALAGDVDGNSTGATTVGSASLRGPVQVVDRGAWSIKGRRQAQEDAFLLHQVSGGGGGLEERTILLAGVLDGHLGSAASSFVRDDLPAAVASLLTVGGGGGDDSVASLLETAWDQCGDSYRASCRTTADECVAEYDAVEGVLLAHTGSQDAVAGTTASIVALDQQSSQLAVLNCGDSRSVVMDAHGRLVFQTVDHTPWIEIDRLTAANAAPECRVARWTVPVGEYDYAVARSLEGPLATSCGIVSAPDVHVQHAEPGMTVVVATDGLWEVIDSAEARQIVSKLKGQRAGASDVAKALCALAYEKASTDNVSVVVLYLD